MRVEVACTRGPGWFEMVGLADGAVRESRVRVNAALGQLGILMAEHRIIVNLAPADLRKSGTAFDLAIAVATLAALGKMPARSARRTSCSSASSRSPAPFGRFAASSRTLAGARALGLRRAIVPRDNAREAGLARGIEVHARPTRSIKFAITCRRARRSTPPGRTRLRRRSSTRRSTSSDVRGQFGGRRALEIAAAGGHNLLFVGPPGGGKTMLARRLPDHPPPAHASTRRCRSP